MIFVSKQNIFHLSPYTGQALFQVSLLLPEPWGLFVQMFSIQSVHIHSSLLAIQGKAQGSFHCSILSFFVINFIWKFSSNWWFPGGHGSASGYGRLTDSLLNKSLLTPFLLFSRFHSFLLFLGYSRAMVRDTKPEDFCKTISNFSLEYRTMQQAILLQRERERERQKNATESPGPNTPVGKRKNQQTPSKVITLN